MQIFFFNDAISIMLCLFLWSVFQTSAAIVSQKIPERFMKYDNRWFRPKKFEKKGLLYKSVFKIVYWKKYLPDGAAVRKSGYRKKNLTDFSIENLNTFLIESCRAEVGHLLAILPFWTFGLFLPKRGIWMMLCYAVVVNIPCVLAQRFNRPRISKILERLERRGNNEV